MIAIDTSAIVAILWQETDMFNYAIAIETDESPILSAATLVELGAVTRRKRSSDALSFVDRFLEEMEIEIVPFDKEQSIIARQAGETFSALNFGDCFSYALAKARDVPLLFKGEDFSQTDIAAAI